MKSAKELSEPAEEQTVVDASAPKGSRSPNVGSKMRSVAKRVKSAYDSVPQGWGQMRNSHVKDGTSSKTQVDASQIDLVDTPTAADDSVVSSTPEGSESSVTESSP
jgi:hypothetical protein